jgi:ribosomal protein S18 acetylase RimI-like enzyme
VTALSAGDARVLTRRATAADLDRCADVLGQAFADYPWTRWTVDADDHVARVTALQRVALEHYGLRYGQVWVTIAGDDIQCVAAWMDSASPAPTSPGMASAVARLEGRRHDASIAAEGQVGPLRPQVRHLYLGAVGTEPHQQGRGLATATLAPVLAQADEQQLACYLETSSATNVAFYERRGFAVVDHIVIDGGGPDVWAMTRR